MSEKNDIEKIDEQIESLLNTQEENTVGSRSEETVEKIGDTKRIDSVKDIEETLEKQKEEVSESESDDNVEELTLEEKTETEEEKEKVVEEVKEEKSDKTKNKKKKVIVGCLIFILILLICLIIFFVTRKKEEPKDTDNTLSSKEQKEIIKQYGDALKGVVNVYYEKEKVILEYKDADKLVDLDYEVNCSDHEFYEDGFIYLNKCSIDGKSTKYSYGEKQEKKEKPQYSENAIKVYVSKSNKATTLKEPKNVDDYDVYAFEIDGTYTDLTLLSEVDGSYVFYADSDYTVHMINFRTGNKVLDMLNYEAVLPIKVGTEYDTNYIAVKMNSKWGIYKLTTNERVVSHLYDEVTPYLSLGVSGPSLCIESLEDGIIAVSTHSNNTSFAYGVIDYRNGKYIIPMEYNSMLKSGDYLLVKDFYGNRHIFNHYGTEYLNDQYDTVYWIVDGKFALVQDGKDTKLVSPKGKEIYNYGKVDIDSINYGFPYNDGALFQGNNVNQVAGDYSTGCIELIYDASKKKGEVKTSECGGIAKPILYLYPKKITKVTVSFEHPEYLQTTYPKFVDSWQVTAHKNGDLYDSNDKYYYGLYWDEAKVHSVDFSTGFYVEKENAISFLEEKLDIIGLNKREANEFIMYWLPILEKNEKNLVYFELTSERESYQKIHITPKPDSLLRIVIHVKKVNEKTSIKEEKLTRFKRSGFTAVEWGGTTY